MRILLTGASGFIGHHIYTALEDQGHEVVACVRNANNWQRHHPESHFCIADFSNMHTSMDWLPLLNGIDIVINAVGIITESDEQTFIALHEKAPKALFQACAEYGVYRVIQISALGADEAAASHYHLSKKATDDFLLNLNIEAAVLQPSLVFGTDGDSSQIFLSQASLPLIPLPGSGDMQVQPIHIDDVVAAILKLVEANKIELQQRLTLVGQYPLSWRDYLTVLRDDLGLAKPRFLPIPRKVMHCVARIAEYIPGTLLNRENLAMLERGDTAGVDSTHDWLGYSPKPVSEFIAPNQQLLVRQVAMLGWLIPMLQLSLGLVWIISGLVAMGLYPPASSYALLARLNIEGVWAPLILYGAALLDITLGILTLVTAKRWLWWFQLLLILIYTAIITAFLSEFWLHPFAPVVKNIPMVAVLILLINLKE